MKEVWNELIDLGKEDDNKTGTIASPESAARIFDEAGIESEGLEAFVNNTVPLEVTNMLVQMPPMRAVIELFKLGIVVGVRYDRKRAEQLRKDVEGD